MQLVKKQTVLIITNTFGKARSVIFRTNVIIAHFI